MSFTKEDAKRVMIELDKSDWEWGDRERAAVELAAAIRKVLKERAA